MTPFSSWCRRMNALKSQGFLVFCAEKSSLLREILEGISKFIMSLTSVVKLVG